VIVASQAHERSYKVLPLSEKVKILSKGKLGIVVYAYNSGYLGD
jgi:hypothetical protein